MPDSFDFDFYREFLGVDIAKMEQVGEVVGKVAAAIYKGMTSAGLSEAVARSILMDAESVILKELMSTKNQVSQ